MDSSRVRVPNWQEVFARELIAAQGKRFRWGYWDCCQWANRMRAALTGNDARSLFPAYRTKAEALTILKDCGGMRGLIERTLGIAIHPAFAQPGDIVLADFGRDLQPGICGGVWSFSPSRIGLEKRKTDSAVAAWAV